MIRVADCPNCGHAAAAHALLDGVHAHPCAGDASATACACALDRAAVNIAIGVAAAILRYGG